MALCHVLVEEHVLSLVNFRNILWRGSEIIYEHALAVLLQIRQSIVHILISHEAWVHRVCLDDTLLKESFQSLLLYFWQSLRRSQMRERLLWEDRIIVICGI